MYRAKREQLGWTSWQPEVDGAAEVRLRDISELRSALAQRELRLHYQPVVPACSAPQDGPRLAEALIRWEHPTRGLLPPTAFLPLAAQTGMMLELSAQVLDLALRHTARWRAQGTDLQVSVNVGADVLASPGFVPLVLDLLDVHGVPPHGLCLELTESEVLTAEGPGLLAEVRRAGSRWRSTTSAPATRHWPTSRTCRWTGSSWTSRSCAGSRRARARPGW